MHHESHYATVTEAINKLRERGFDLDFNPGKNCVICNGQKFNAEELEIVDVYRYEGNTDPSDEAIVYAIEAQFGLKGILVDGYGASADNDTSELIKKIRIRK
ncbi:MAG: hypothetical protein GC181_14235 [Bacteroidetes bacterium]|nr:hypothetical protein [Bacteroidota bacterium]